MDLAGLIVKRTFKLGVNKAAVIKRSRRTAAFVIRFLIRVTTLARLFDKGAVPPLHQSGL